MVKVMLKSSDKKQSPSRRISTRAFSSSEERCARSRRSAASTDFRRVCEAADIGTRKAYYLASITKNIEGLHIPTKRLRAIGWTKLMTLAPHLTKANWKDLLTAAENNTNRELQMLVKGETPADNSHCVLLYFNDEDYADFVKSALHHGAARSGRGLLHKEKAIMALVKKDLEEPHEAAPKKPSAAKKKLPA